MGWCNKGSTMFKPVCTVHVSLKGCAFFDNEIVECATASFIRRSLTRMVLYIRERSSRDDGGKCSRQARMKSEGDGPQVKDSRVPRDEYLAASLRKVY